MINTRVWQFALTCLAMAAVFSVSTADELPSVDGLMGLESEDGHGWMAIRLSMDEVEALSGILWYNNDAATVFPSILVGTGHESGPDAVSQCFAVASNVVGLSDGWSECTFEQPIGAIMDAMYVVFEFPVGEAFSGRGHGGGPAIGYSDGLIEPRGWISGDGESWHPLSGDNGFAVIPVLIPYQEGMMVKSFGGENDDIPDVPEDYYTNVGPNPFNPQVVVRFGLPVSGRTRVDVYDIRGRRIARLMDRFMPAGHHAVTWRGQDQSGRRMASGQYFLRIDSGELDEIKRVTMVK